MSKRLTDRSDDLSHLVRKLVDLSTGNPIAEEPRRIKHYPGGPLPARTGGEKGGSLDLKGAAKRRDNSVQNGR